MPQRGRRVPPAELRRPRLETGLAIMPARSQRKGEGLVDLTLPRVCYYRAFGDDAGSCPSCGSVLIQHYASYLISTSEQGQAADSFISGSKAGWFCAQCATVVINSNAVGYLLSQRLPHWNIGQRFVVLGIVDFDAVPQEMRRLPLGSDDNPIPLVAFTHEAEEAR
jgi:hypothetical protein